MKILKYTALAIAMSALLAGALPAPSAAEGQAAGTREVIAVVNGEEIYLDELEKAIADRHRELTGMSEVSWVGYEGVLDRLISSRLVVQEAMDIGLEERPEIKEKLRRFADSALVRMLQENLLRDVQAGEDEIERLYRDEIRHWRFRAISFEALDQAAAFRKEINEGGDFESVGERYVQDGTAVWEGPEQEVREAEIAPEISAAFLGKEPGTVTQVIRAAGRFFSFKLTGVTYPDNPAALRRAKRKALSLEREDVIARHTGDLMEKYADVDRDVLATIGKGDFVDIEKDSRVVAKIPGEEPVLVVDLLHHLQGEFYHGGKDEEHRETLAADPESVLRGALEQPLYAKEARLLGIDKTDRYLEAVAAFGRSLVFGMYIEQFLVPQARLDDDEVRAAYEARTDEFLMPRTVRIESLAFTSEDDARNALENLRRGADLRWMSRNAQGLKGEGVTAEDLVLETLPADLQAKMGDAAPGDAGLYEAGNGTYRVYLIKQFPPRGREPFEKARPVLARELFDERLNQVIADLVAELRELSEITVYKDKLRKKPLE